MTGSTERFYDEFSQTFVRDYVFGNRRVDRQFAFLKAAIPPTISSALVIGCGSGDSSKFLAKRIAPGCTVLAIDISSANLRLAQALHAHPRVSYRKVDVLATDEGGEIRGPFDVVVLPDVYEHIPKDQRSVLHARLDRLLAPNGRVLLTVPSPAKQASLKEKGSGLQIVDEVVTADDLQTLAHDVHGELTYLNLISVWDANDYMHAAIARGTARLAPIDTATPLHSSGSGLTRAWHLARAGFRYLNLKLRVGRRG